MADAPPSQPDKRFKYNLLRIVCPSLKAITVAANARMKQEIADASGIDQAAGFFSKFPETVLITVFARFSVDHWDKIARNDISFFIDNMDGVFGSILQYFNIVEKSMGFKKLFSVKGAVTEEEIEALFMNFQVFVRNVVQHARTSGMYSLVTQGRLNVNDDAKFDNTLMTPNLIHRIQSPKAMAAYHEICEKLGIDP